MSSGTRYCKFHLVDGESQHWALIDRGTFALGGEPHYMPDTQVLPRHMKLDLFFDWDLERVWGTTIFDLEVMVDGVESLSLDAVNLDISKVKLGERKTDFENRLPFFPKTKKSENF